MSSASSDAGPMPSSSGAALKDQLGHGLAEGERATTPQRIFIALMVVATGVAFLLLFSGLPYCYGDEIYLRLSEEYGWSLFALGFATILSVSLYVFDVRYWRGCWRLLGYVLIAVAVLGFAAAALLATKEYVVAPVALFLFGAPFLFVGVKELLFPRTDIVQFLQALQLGIWVGALGSLAVWLGWILMETKWWNVVTKAEFYRRMRCEVSSSINATGASLSVTQLSEELIDALSDAQRERLDDQLVGCTSAFLLWLLPFILFAWGIVFSGALFFIIRTLEQARAATSRAKAMDPLAQGFLMFVGLGLLGVWAAAGIAGAEMDLTNVVLALAFLFMIMCGITVTAVFGWAEIRGGLTGSPLGQRMVAAVRSDWTRAIMLMLIAPFFLGYLLLSVLTQFCRKYLSCTKTLKPEYRGLILTHSASLLMRDVLAWRWTSVLAKTQYVGIFFFVFVVGVARLTTLFLSWLNETLQPVPLATTTGIFALVGIAMFLLPPVPGVPVYLSGGIILVASAQESMGFWVATVYTMAVCFALKLCAIVLQQKVIGERMASKRVWIRQAVGINSVEIRAIRDILLQPGLDIRKVSILCGGPDWPTSVLTGILRLRLSQMMLGSLPVFFLIAPTVLAAALLLRANEGGAWGSVSTMVLALAVLVQSASMLAAIHFIAKNVVEKEEELRALPDDEEVLELERNQAKRLAVRRAVSAFSRIGALQRVLMCASAASITASCYIFQLFGSLCFVTFQVDDSIDDVLDGDALNLVKPLGWAALGLFLVPCVYLGVFNRAMTLRTNAAMKDPAHWAHGEDAALVAGGADAEQQGVLDGDADVGETAVRRRICCRAFLPCVSRA